jgi:acyl transferase domain-containing protein
LHVYANAPSQPYKTTAKELAAAVASQIASPVLFREQIEAMYAAGARIFMEVGPGNVVAGLVSDTLGTRPYTVLSLDNKRNNGVAQFLGATGALAVAGLTLDFAALYAEAPASAPKMAPSKHAVFLTGANYDRPYPPKNGAAGRAPPNATARPMAESVSNSTSPTPPPQRTEPLMPDQNGRQPVPSSLAPAAQAGARVELSSPVERIWEQVSARHQDYLHAMADSHRAYLNAAASLLGQAGALPAEPQMLAAPPATPTRAPAPPVSVPEPAVYADPAPAPKPKTNGSGGAHAFTPPAPTAPAPAVRPSSVAVTPVAPAPATQPAPATASIDAAGIVRAIVSEKTGYPPDMLDVDMDLEGELGVDSIKQVEILSALRDRLPHLPEIEPERLVELRTIAAIAAMISAATPSASAAPAPAAAPTVVSKPAAVAASSSVLVSADVVRALIAEKTGYPSDML